MDICRIYYMLCASVAELQNLLFFFYIVEIQSIQFLILVRSQFCHGAIDIGLRAYMFSIHCSVYIVKNYTKLQKYYNIKYVEYCAFYMTLFNFSLHSPAPRILLETVSADVSRTSSRSLCFNTFS